MSKERQAWWLSHQISAALGKPKQKEQCKMNDNFRYIMSSGPVFTTE